MPDHTIRLARPDEECMHCLRTPASGVWGKPCPSSPDKLHWTQWMRDEGEAEKLQSTARSLSRAAYELERVAEAIEQLPTRQRRRLLRGPECLDPLLIRNEAERARDTLHVYGLLDA
jgi:hypothetical protein